MPPEPTTPIEPVEGVNTVDTEESTGSEREVIVDPVVSPNPPETLYGAEPVVEAPIVEPVVIVPEPTSEPVVIVDPVVSPNPPETLYGAEPVVVVPTESAPEPIIEAPISEPVIIPEPSVVPAPVLETSHSVLVTNPEPTPTPEPKLDSFHINMARARELLVKARYVIQLNKKKKMDKIMGLFDKHAPTHIRNRIGVGEVKVTNREVRDLLRLSHDMVNIYMNVLIKEGKIKREGKSSATHYTKV